MRVQKIISAWLNSMLWVGIIPLLVVGGYILYDANLVHSSADLPSELAILADGDDDSALEVASRESNAVVGWLKIDGTNINYPLVRGENNSFYLARNYKGEFATAGSAFLDYRNTGDFSDKLTIIYGHRMGYGRMFSDVTKFDDEGFFHSHETGRLITLSEKYELRIKLFAKIKADEVLVYDVKAVQDGRAIDYLSQVAIWKRDIDFGGRFLLLSTCDEKDKSLRDVLLIQASTRAMLQ